MREHVHLLISEPKRGDLSLAVQMLKQVASRKLGCGDRASLRVAGFASRRRARNSCAILDRGWPQSSRKPSILRPSDAR